MSKRTFRHVSVCIIVNIPIKLFYSNWEKKTERVRQRERERERERGRERESRRELERERERESVIISARTSWWAQSRTSASFPTFGLFRLRGPSEEDGSSRGKSAPPFFFRVADFVFTNHRINEELLNKEFWRLNRRVNFYAVSLYYLYLFRQKALPSASWTHDEEDIRSSTQLKDAFWLAASALPAVRR